ncbi:hypothetical protein F4804DRAFT_54998 [Jackrogersella minutella]|nr:hypothetical protein F4804DRAFT_54998 [Jackrogersella minutella]
MAPQTSALEVNDNQWPGAGIFNIEGLPSIAPTPGNDGVFVNIGGVENTKPPLKQLACARCYTQKLRCVRKRHARICDRCFNANLECVDRQPQRMGRPVDRTNLRIRSQQTGNGINRRNNDGGTTLRSPRTQQEQTNTHPHTFFPDALPDSGGATTQPTSHSASVLDDWPWTNSPIDSSIANTGNSSNQKENGNYISSQTLLNNNIDVQSHNGSLAAEFHPTSLLHGLDDFDVTFFPHGTEPAPLESQSDPKADVLTYPPSPAEDPVEQLSKLHLELYQCLTSVKTVEKMKKAKMQSKSYETEVPIDTRWSERTFQTAERFIDALQNYVDTDADKSKAMHMTHDEGEQQDIDAPIQVDIATGLMIVSCYTRLLQIFEVVVFVVEIFQEMDCPGTYVQISFGNFCPTKDKDLHARLLGQYVLHLLNGISAVVDKAVASRQPYARSITEIREIEVKLKERISATLR